MEMPRSTAGWIFLIAITALALSSATWFVISEVQQVLAQHQYILENLPEDVQHINTNVIILCSTLEADCIP